MCYFLIKIKNLKVRINRYKWQKYSKSDFESFYMLIWYGKLKKLYGYCESAENVEPCSQENISGTSSHTDCPLNRGLAGMEWWPITCRLL